MICFDIRVAPDIPVEEFEAQLERWCEESGGGIRLDYGDKDPVVAPTKLDDSNPFWAPFRAALDAIGVQVRIHTMPGNTDILFVRALGIPAVGFSPMNNTPVLLHDHDEYLQADVFLRGIEIYRKVIEGIANV